MITGALLAISLSWTPPLERTNGEPLGANEIAGYVVRSDCDGSKDETPVGNVLKYRLDDKFTGGCTFDVAVFDTDGIHSAFVGDVVVDFADATDNKKLWWSVVPEAAGYNVRVVTSGSPHATATPQSVSIANEIIGESGQREIEINLFNIGALENKSGTFDFYISSVDSIGRESEAAFLVDSIEIDFFLPAAPTAGGIR